MASRHVEDGLQDPACEREFVSLRGEAVRSMNAEFMYERSGAKLHLLVKGNQMEKELLFHLENGVATITINRPEKRNSFTDEMIRQWVAWLEECKARDDVRVIVFTGSESSFSSGGDIS